MGGPNRLSDRNPRTCLRIPAQSQQNLLMEGTWRLGPIVLDPRASGSYELVMIQATDQGVGPS